MLIGWILYTLSDMIITDNTDKYFDDQMFHRNDNISLWPAWNILNENVKIFSSLLIII